MDKSSGEGEETVGYLAPKTATTCARHPTQDRQSENVRTQMCLGRPPPTNVSSIAGKEVRSSGNLESALIRGWGRRASANHLQGQCPASNLFRMLTRLLARLMTLRRLSAHHLFLAKLGQHQPSFNTDDAVLPRVRFSSHFADPVPVAHCPPPPNLSAWGRCMGRSWESASGR